MSSFVSYKCVSAFHYLVFETCVISLVFFSPSHEFHWYWCDPGLVFGLRCPHFTGVWEFWKSYAL
jgi:hypothetical protein